jgi:hypothetical protein
MADTVTDPNTGPLQDSTPTASQTETESATGSSDEGNGSPQSAVAPVTTRPRFQRKKIVLLSVLAALLLALIYPAIWTVSFGINGYHTYSELKTQADEGVQHLLTVKTLLDGVKAHPSQIFSASVLQRVQRELGAARGNFEQTSSLLNHSEVIQEVSTYLPQYRAEIASARSISRIGIDIAEIGQTVAHSAQILAPSLQGALHGGVIGSTSQQPLITPAMLKLIGTTIDSIMPQLRDIERQSSGLSLNSLPVSAHERAQVATLLAALPQAIPDLQLARSNLNAVGWLLGVGAPRTYLVQTMDRSELRATGGFTGQYGELHINSGRMAPFSLRDISLIEYASNSPTLGKLAPAPYQSWWPFPNWGLRDSNLSADFPTSAQYAIADYKYETGTQVDGVIAFTTFAMEHVLQVTGPIYVQPYNVTITAQNIEQELHFYQLNNVGIAQQIATQPGNSSTSARKRFTSLLADLIIEKVRHAPLSEMIAIGQQVLFDLKTKDVQVYVTNPQVEQTLAHYGLAGAMNLSTSEDGLYIVQANVSASKATPFVRTIFHDTVTLNAQGGATHVLQMRFVYSQVATTYDYDTYHDYVRVYVPPSSKFLWGDGFDTGTPLCGGPLASCPQRDVYPGEELMCTPGQFQPGAASPSFSDPNGGDWHPLDTVGPPTNFSSDEPGRAMFGGFVIIPKNCTMTVTLSWYVPPQGSSPYALLFQRQAGTFPELDLTIMPTPGNCASLASVGLHFNGTLGQDMLFSLSHAHTQAHSACYPQPPV